MALVRAGTLSGIVRSVRGTPEQVRVVMHADGLGELDAVAGLDAAPLPGVVVGLVADASRMAVLEPPSSRR